MDPNPNPNSGLWIRVLSVSPPKCNRLVTTPPPKIHQNPFISCWDILQMSVYTLSVDSLSITASIVQGSVLGPGSYLVTASDLQPLSSSNVSLKFADDTRLIIPVSSQSIYQLEIQNIEGWVDRNNLKLNRKKSYEIVFLRPRSNRQTQIPPPAVDGFDKVQHMIIALSVTLCHNFCMCKHIDTVITSCARTLYGLRTLRAHGMP